MPTARSASAISRRPPSPTRRPAAATTGPRCWRCRSSSLGEERALAVARAAVGDDAPARACCPTSRTPPCPRGLRDGARRTPTSTSTTSAAGYTKELGAGDQPLIKLRRVTWGSLLNLALLGDRRLHADRAARRPRPRHVRRGARATPSGGGWPSPSCSPSCRASRRPSAPWARSPAPLPLGPLVALQFAICYVNLAIPSTAARVAINVRFFQRFGVGADHGDDRRRRSTRSPASSSRSCSS